MEYLDEDELKEIHERGIALYYGRGAPEDRCRAIDEFRKAAEQDYEPSQFMLGKLYEQYGLDEEAFQWYQKAAGSFWGHTGAQLRLGRMYEEGRGTKQDLEAAVYWYAEAAEWDSSGEAWQRLNQIYKKRKDEDNEQILDTIN